MNKKVIDTAAKRAKLCDTPSSSSSSHEIAPTLHDSSGEVEDPQTRGSVLKKSRVGAVMEISARKGKRKRNSRKK